MKRLFREDIKIYLSNVLMALMALVVIELAFAFGAISKNKGLAETALQMFLYVLIVLVVVFMVMTGKAFLEKLRGGNHYYEAKKEQGYNRFSLLLGLNTVYASFFFGILFLYVSAFALDAYWCSKVFVGQADKADNAEDWSEIIKLVKKYYVSDRYFLSICLIVLVLIAASISIAALVAFSTTMAYNLFTKSRYAGILAGIFILIFGYALLNIGMKVTSVEGPDQQNLMALLVLLGASVVFLAITLASLKKHEWIDEPH